MAGCCRSRIPECRARCSISTKSLRNCAAQCGERQVAGAELGLVHSLGAGFATNATTILGTENTL